LLLLFVSSPSGYFHSVHNLSHPTLSLNHNWCNAHCLPAMYSSLCDEVSRAREAIADVKELLERRKGELGEEGVRREWEIEVDGLVERSEGWRCVFSSFSWTLQAAHAVFGSSLLYSFPSFFAMIHHTLQNLGVPQSTLEERAKCSRWPAVWEEVRPAVDFVIEQVRCISFIINSR
jgi:hypothetical protein